MRASILFALSLAVATPVSAEPIHDSFIGSWAAEFANCSTNAHKITPSIFLSCKLLAADQPLQNTENGNVTQLIAMECSLDGKPTTHFANVTLKSKDTLEVSHARGDGSSQFVRCTGQ